MTLLKTSFLSLIATLVKMLSILVINKAVAVFIGPSGLALVGQFQNFLQLSMKVSQGGINQGVTKYTAEYRNDGKSLGPLFGTSARIAISCSILSGAAMIVFAEPASTYLLNSPEYAYVFIIYGITVSFFVLNQLLLSVVNGLKEVSTFVRFNIVQSLYSLVFTSMLVVFFSLDGALVALVTNQSIVFLIVLWRLRSHSLIHLELFASSFSREQARKLLGYAAMAITSAATVPVSQLVIRNHLGSTLGWDQAGYWQAIWYISTMYLTVVTTALGVYYLPRLSEISDADILRKELVSGYKIIMPAVIAMAIGIFVLKDFVIWLVFTEDFAPMRKLFAWQLIGDVIKLAAWLLSYLIIAKAMVRTFVITEIMFSVLFVALSCLFINVYGLIGVTYAFSLNYAIYLIAMILVVRMRVFPKAA